MKYATSRFAPSRQKGLAAVEAAMVFPLLLLFLFGAINYGFALYNKSLIVNASREAAREGVVLSVAGVPNQTTLNQIASRHAQDLQSKLITFGASASPVVSVSSADSNQNVAASISYNFRGVAAGLFAGQSISSGMPISATTKMRFE